MHLYYIKLRLLSEFIIKSIQQLILNSTTIENLMGSWFCSEQQYKFNHIHQHSQWDSEIKPILIDITNKKLNVKQIIEKLNFFRTQFASKKENPKGSSQPKFYNFAALRSLYGENELLEVFSGIASIIITTKGRQIIFLTYSKDKKQRIFPKRSILYILCCMFMCLIPKQQFDDSYHVKDFHYLTHFSIVLSDVDFKTKCIVEYIKLQVNKFKGNQGYNEQKLTIIRNITHKNVQYLINANKQRQLRKLQIVSDKCDIESYYGQIKISFANKFIGGGALRYGSVQEEILVACHPELYATMILCSVMKDNQALGFRGFKKYFNTSGYKQSVMYRNHQDHKYTKSELDQDNQYIVAIDAQDYSYQQWRQYQKKQINRQIIKAYTGFTCIHSNKKIITGNWGCGVFRGNPQLKLIIQWIAASLADKDILFCPYGQEKNLIHHKLLILQGKKIKDVYQNLIKASTMYRNQFINTKAKFYDVFFSDN